MRETKYICDICGEKIEDQNKAIATGSMYSPDGYFEEKTLEKASQFAYGERHFHLACIRDLDTIAKNMGEVQ